MKKKKKKWFLFILFLRTGFILDPQTHLYHWWLAIISLAVIYNLLLIPARYSFTELDKKLRRIWLSLDYTFDFIYLIDILLQSRTGSYRNWKSIDYVCFLFLLLIFKGYFSHGLFVRNHHVLSRGYFASRRFYSCDLLSIIPTDILYLFPRWRFVSIVRSNRFLRIYRLLEFQELTESRTRFPNAFRIGVLVCLTLTLIHW